MKTTHHRRNLIILALFVVGFINSATAPAQSAVGITPFNKIEIIYFHAPNRCPGCVAAEDRTKEILTKHFKAEMNRGKISFVSLDLKDEKNKALVEKYEIVFPTLLILKKLGTEEIKTDFSTTAFQYAYTQPGKYGKLLKAEINKALHNE